jgi:hypothetical protein
MEKFTTHRGYRMSQDTFLDRIADYSILYVSDAFYMYFEVFISLRKLVSTWQKEVKVWLDFIFMRSIIFTF